MRVVMRLGGWQPCPEPPYCKGQSSAKVSKAVHSAPRDVKQLLDLPGREIKGKSEITIEDYSFKRVRELLEGDRAGMS
jgi:hypothetical protein